jgi:predicted 2-oxoglutarate/Fe(II)-dependent dioxygenase YbiX
MSSQRPVIGRGERGPDFALPRDGGQQGPVRFYGLVGGRPAVLLFAGEADDGRVPDLAARLGSADEVLDVLVITQRPDPRMADAFHDPEGHVHAAYGATDDQPVAVVLDHNVRVTDVHGIVEVEPTAASILDGLPRWAADHTEVAPRLAPVLFVPDALAPELCARLIERWETQGSVETGVETIVEGARAEATDVRRKRRRDHTVEDQQLLRELTRHIGDRVFPELQKAFAFAAGGFEGFKIGCYTSEDRGHFEAHRDNLSTATAHRRFGLTLNLNDDYDGGELRFGEYGPTRYRPAAGEALVFSGTHLHEVLPVVRGRRFVLLSFVLAAQRR